MGRAHNGQKGETTKPKMHFIPGKSADVARGVEPSLKNHNEGAGGGTGPRGVTT